MSTSYLPATTESVAQALEAKTPSESISILYRILENPSSSPEALRIKEQAITNLSDLLRQENRAEDLRSLLTQLRPYFSLIPKAKTAKIVRSIIDAVAKIPGTSDLQISLCKEMVQWTRAEKRTFLRQRVEARLAALLMENKEFVEALNLLSGLIKEVRRLDDKLLLVDINLLESKLHFSLRNLPKAKAALTAARTAANAIYVPPAQQGTIDLQSGILHAEEKDYKTAYSYFFEAFEAFNALEDPRAVFSLKYMLLCKIMVNQADDVAGVISSKAGLQYVGPELDAMKAVADAHSKRSLKLFETALRNFKAQLEEDPIVHRHLSSLYDTLLEQNLCRLIEPYSRVEISRIAELIELPGDHVEKKLSQMILDKKFAGTLDQGAGCLIIFNDPKTDALYPATLETISNIGKVVDSLYVRSSLRFFHEDTNTFSLPVSPPKSKAPPGRLLTPSTPTPGQLGRRADRAAAAIDPLAAPSPSGIDPAPPARARALAQGSGEVRPGRDDPVEAGVLRASPERRARHCDRSTAARPIPTGCGLGVSLRRPDLPEKEVMTISGALDLLQ
ncbi:hypothetical protein NL676_032309 [Syzygium grande]|nr:hypothetical protein NL676_032309 [Syzygium grande]